MNTNPTSGTVQDQDINTSRLPHNDIEEIMIQSRARPGENPVECHIRALDYALSTGGSIYAHEIFTAPDFENEIITQAEKRFGAIEWPVTHITDNGGSNGFGGSCVRLVRKTELHPLTLGARIVGNWFEDKHARYAYLGDLPGKSGAGSREEQIRAVFKQMMDALSMCGMDFSNVVRTWFYNRDILAWYDVFNRVRTEFFRTHGVFDGLVPASTGIGSANARGTELTAALFAVSAKNGQDVKTAAIPSPMQCPALKYGSSFSRAAEILTPDSRRLFVSGTASIAPDGRTVHCGNTKEQVRLTMDVVQAILRLRGMNWDAVRHSLVYVRNIEDVDVFADYCESHGVTIPYVQTHQTVCRDDLLFEIEVDAFATLLPETLSERPDVKKRYQQLRRTIANCKA